jgi:alpha-amylase
MVQRCTNAGVDVYVDLVINHSPGRVSPNDTKTGIAGTKYGHYWVENLFNFSDYNDCKQDITNYNDAVNVQYCDLVELMDLRTGSTYVRGKIADYMKHLLGKGVKGFRIDAAKHMPDADLNAIVSSVRQDYPNFYVFQEVIDISTTEAVDSGQYLYVGDVTEFIYSAEIGRVFRHGKLAWLEALGEGWQQGGTGQAMMNSASAVVFVDNHDNQRGHGAGGADIITHKDGQLYDLANVFMLAWPYGYPKVMSSFAFGHSDQGPPSSTIYSGPTDTTANCFQEWQCEHRWRPIGNMVAFRNQTASAFNVSNWWSNGNNQIAFGRGDKGYVVINKESQNLDRWFETGLPEGTYCDVISGDKSGGSCTGNSISVQVDGWAHITVDAGKATAIHAGAKL